MELISQYTFILVYRLFIHIPFKSFSSCQHQTKKVSSYSATTPQVYVLSTFDMGFKEKTLCILLLFASGCLGIGMSSGQTIIGIDLGMPYSSVGVYRNGKVEIIENEQGNRITPSCVAFTDREVLIGEAAKNQSHLNAERTICDFKRLIGRKFHNPEVQRVQSISPYKIVDKDGKPYVEVKRNGETSVFSPEEIAAMVLRKMKDMAEAYLGEEIKKAVVTVPGSTYYNANDYKQRTAIRDACEMVGIDVPRLLAEPYAALIAYGLHEELDKNVLVLDIRTSRSEIFVLNKDYWSGISSQSSDRNFGGQNFDYRLMDYFVKLIKKKHEKDVSQDKEALGKLLRECERARVELSHKGYAARVEVKLLFDGVDFSERLVLETFEELNIDLLKRVLVLVKKALEGANLKKLDIHEIVFVGGGTRVPKLKQLVKDFFLGKKPLDSINVDEVVAYGAAIKGADLGEDKIKDILLAEMIPVSMGIETVGGVMTKVVPRDTIMPARESITLTTYQDHQTSLLIKIYGGERAFAKDCREIVSFNLSDIAPAPRGVPQIEVKFLMKGDEKVHVIARDMASGNSKSITLLMPFNASRVMRCLIKEAETFEEEDKKMVERIEARKKLERFFKIGSSLINNCNVDVFTSEIVDEENAKHVSKDVLGWLYELDKKVNDWEALVSPVMRKSCEIIVGRDPDDYEETTHDEL